MSSTREIASRAGVSQATVSRVLNHHAYVSEEVRERVITVMKEMNYRPNSVARAVTPSNSRTIGVLLEDIKNPFWAETVEAITVACQSSGHQVVLCHTGRDPVMMGRSLEMMLHQKVAGILFASVHHQDLRVASLAQAGFPCVFYIRRPAIARANYVVVDNRKGASLAVQHLYDLGHRSIAHLSGWREASTFSERREGFITTCQELGVPIDPELVVEAEGTDQLPCGCIQALMKRKNRPTAIFAGNDRLALQALDQFWQLGVRVPEDIALVGFDDIDMANIGPIGLTSVSQQKHLMAKLAIESLIAVIDQRKAGGQMEPCRIVLEPHLVVRRTCGARVAVEALQTS
jgi:LacI family transcriptional regulator